MRSSYHHAVGLCLVLAVPALCAADAPATPDKQKTPQQHVNEAKAEAVKAIKEGVEQALARHPETSAEMKAALRSPALHEQWVKCIQDQSGKALANLNLKDLPIDEKTKNELSADMRSQALRDFSESATEEALGNTLRIGLEEKFPPAKGNGRNAPGSPWKNLPKGTHSAEKSYTGQITRDKDGNEVRTEEKSYKVDGKEVSKAEYERVRGEMFDILDRFRRMAQKK